MEDGIINSPLEKKTRTFCQFLADTWASLKINTGTVNPPLQHVEMDPFTVQGDETPPPTVAPSSSSYTQVMASTPTQTETHHSTLTVEAAQKEANKETNIDIDYDKDTPVNLVRAGTGFLVIAGFLTAVALFSGFLPLLAISGLFATLGIGLMFAGCATNNAEKHGSLCERAFPQQDYGLYSRMYHGGAMGMPFHY